MKRSLLGKLIFFYIIAAILIFTLINTVGIHYISNQLITEKKHQLSVYSQYIKEHHFETAIDTNTIYSLKSISRQMAATDSILEARTWIVDSNGYLIIDSANENLKERTKNILTADADYLDSYYHINKKLDTFLSKEMLAVILPIANRFQIEGYVVTHYPMEEIVNTTARYRFLINFGIVVILLIFALVLFCIWWITIRPTKKLLHYVSASNQGDHNATCELHSRDEFEKLQLELNYMEDKIRNLDNYQKNFIANVSHDFRSPLTSIKGYAEAMLDGTIPEEMRAKYLDVIVFEAERLSKLTNNLLSLNQFEQNRHTLEVTSFDINRMLKQTAASFEGTCMQKHIKLKLTFSEKETFVNADEAKIQQVLHNLLDNAIKFSYKDSEIHIKSNEHREKVQISVKDFGIGIPKDGISKIWERFYKTDLSRGKDKKGTGLGLSITKEIISAHNETINVTSTEGAGTEFTFTLPLATPNEL